MDSGTCTGSELIAECDTSRLTEKFKNNIQTKYMDWVVHGYKFMVR